MQKDNARSKNRRKIRVDDKRNTSELLKAGRWEAKVKGDKSKVRILNTIFNNYHIDKENYYNSQRKR